MHTTKQTFLVENGYEMQPDRTRELERPVGCCAAATERSSQEAPLISDRQLIKGDRTARCLSVVVAGAVSSLCESHLHSGCRAHFLMLAGHLFVFDEAGWVQV